MQMKAFGCLYKHAAFAIEYRIHLQRECNTAYSSEQTAMSTKSFSAQVSHPIPMRVCRDVYSTIYHYLLSVHMHSTQQLAGWLAICTAAFNQTASTVACNRPFAWTCVRSALQTLCFCFCIQIHHYSMCISRVFRKGGVITSLDEYTSISSSTANDVASASHPSTAAPASLGPQIGFSNVGYQLLKRAGWQEGQGLGSSQQGRSIPLAACHQQASQWMGAWFGASLELGHRMIPD